MGCIMWLSIVSVFLVWFRRFWKLHAAYGHLKGASSFMSLPLLGHGYLLGTDPIRSLYKMKAKYGDIFRLDVGNLPGVVVCNMELLEQAYRSEAFNARPYNHVPSFKKFRPVDSKGAIAGVAVAQGQPWHEQRRFMVRQLQNLGMGKTYTMEEVVGQECLNLIGLFERNVKFGMPTNIKGTFTAAINNVVWRITTGRRTRQDDPELVALVDRLTIYLRSLDPGSVVGMLQHQIVAFCQLCGWLGVNNPITAVLPINEMIQEQVHLSDPDDQGNYIERHLAEIEKNVSNEDSSFHPRDGLAHLLGQMQDIFVAGTETVATSLEWTVLYLCRHQDWQEKISKEAREHLRDQSTTISLSQRPDMPLTQAFIEEVARHCPQGAIQVPHFATNDFMLGRFLIPKGTQLFPFGVAINHDPNVFWAPEDFRPERFITQEGKFKGIEKMLFYGVGKRRCPGEILARVEIFLFITSLVARYKFEAFGQLDFTPVPGLTFYTKPYKVIVTKRGQ